jgi:hypothetical protein
MPKFAIIRVFSETKIRSIVFSEAQSGYTAVTNEFLELSVEPFSLLRARPSAVTYRRSASMYIGIGTVVLILVIIVAVLLLRRT